MSFFGGTSGAPSFSFGAPAASTATSTGAPAPSLFGSTTTAPGTGLFGAPPSAAPAAGGSSLFGQPPAGSTAPAPGAGGGLFGGGASASTAPKPAFSFGAPAAAASTGGGGGGLFGSMTAATPAAGAGAGMGTTGSLFGGGAGAGGGLFGAAKPAQPAGQAGGLFGASTAGQGAQAGGGGLFGASTAAAGTTGAPAFGASTAQPAAGSSTAITKNTKFQDLPDSARNVVEEIDNFTTTPASASRHDAAFATLPARLSRAASISRKRERDAARTTMWKSLSTRAKYYVPVLHWLPSYTPRKFASDVVAALTLTSMIVPQAMSYSTNLVHSDPVHGLFGVAIPAMIYSVLGTCRQLSLGPEAALSLIMGETIAKFIEAEEHAHGGKMSPADKAKLTVTLTTIITFESGLVTFLLGFFRLGFLDAVLSRALLRGFITAVGLVIFISQLIPILGLEHALAAAHGSYSSIPAKLGFLVTHLGNTHRLTLAVSSAALAVLVGAKAFKRTVARRKGCGWTKFVPEVLLVVLASTFLSHLFRWDRAGLEVLGRISPGAVKIRIPFLGWGHWKTYVHQCLGTATVIAVLGFLDSIVAAKDMASKFDYPISPNRELTALGVANLSNSLFTGSLPGFGSITRSRLAAATGATTQMAGLLTGTFVLLVTYFLLGFLRSLPKCILAVIVCVVVFSILEEAPHDVKFFWKMRAWVDGAMMLLTFVLSLFVSVEVGIIVSVALSLVLCVKQSTSMNIKILGRVPGTTYFEELDDLDGADGLLHLQEELPGVLIVRIRDVNLTFANTGAMKERLRRLERYGHRRHHPADEPARAEASVVIFQLVDVGEVDASALQLVAELVESYSARSVLVYWVQCQPRVLARLREAGIIELSGGDSHIQSNIAQALEVLNDTMVTIAGTDGVVV